MSAEQRAGVQSCASARRLVTLTLVLRQGKAAKATNIYSLLSLSVNSVQLTTGN